MFAEYQHCAYAISAVNGTVTLEMGLQASGIGDGAEVVLPCISFVATATAVTRMRAVPVFVDIEPYSFNIDPVQIERAISPRTEAILAVHFGGPMANMDAILDIGRRHGIPVFEDAAHAHGSEWNGRRAGSLGVWASFSFQNGKVLTAGEGGMVTTNDAQIAATCRSIANCGRREDGPSFFHHYISSANYRLSALHAAVLIAQFEKLESEILLRRERAALLRGLLSGVPGLRLQEEPAACNRHSNYLLPGRIDAAAYGMDRNAFHKMLTSAGVPCTPFYPHPLYGNPLYADGVAPSRVLPCPNAEACIQDAFWLPHRALMGDEETTRAIAHLIASRGRG
jgi:dTDP-4-amino-4,6-dideoxygalactose transaminase